jgi:hypothetical protein
MLSAGAWGKMIHENQNLKQKSPDTVHLRHVISAVKDAL